MDVGLRYIPVGAPQVITVGGTAVGLAPPTNAIFCVISVETNAVRYRDDGTAPAGQFGILIPVNTIFEYSGNLNAIQFAAQAGASNINVSYYRLSG